MAASGTLVIRFIGDIKDFERDLARVQASTSGTWGKIGKAAAAGAALAGTALVAFGVKAAGLEATFSKTMNQVQAAAKVPQKEMGALSDLAIKMGRDTVFSASEASQAMLALAKGGMSAAQIKAGALEAALKLAAAGGIDMETSAKVMGNALNAFGLKAGNASRVADALAGAANASSADIGDLAEALAQVSAVASDSGFSIQETTAALAAFANKGIMGSDAGTSLKTMLARLVPQTNTARNAMMQFGLASFDASVAQRALAKEGIKTSSFDVESVRAATEAHFAHALGLDADSIAVGKAADQWLWSSGIFNSAFLDARGNFEGLATISGALQKALSKLSDEERTTALHAVFGSDARRAATILMREGEAGIRDYIKATSDQTAAQKMADAGMKGTAGAWEQLKGSIETVTLQFGLLIAPAVQGGLKLLTEGVNAIGPAFQKIAAWFSSGGAGGPVGDALRGIMDAVVEVGGKLLNTLGPAFMAVWRLIKEVLLPAFAAIIPVVGPVVEFIIRMLGSALVGVIQGAVKVINGFVDVVTGLFKLVKAVLTGEWGEAWDAVKQILSGALEAIIGAVQVWFNVGVLAIFKQGVKALLGHWTGLWDGVKSIATNAFGSVRKFLDDTWAAIGSLFTHAWTKVIKPVLEAIANFLTGAIRTAFTAWRNNVESTWAGIRTVFETGWNIVRAIFQALKGWLDDTLQAAFAGMRNTARAVWESVQLKIEQAWEVIRGIFVAIRDFLNNPLSNAWTGIKTVVDTAWTAIKNIVSNMWHDHIKGIFDTMRDWLGKEGVLADAFKMAVAAIANVWGNLKEAAATPVRFVVNTVYNNGIRKMIGALPGVDPPPEVKLGFASGGRVWGPGTETSDSIPAWLSRNEFVVKASVAKKVMPFLQALNSGKMSLTYAEGGPVWPTTFRSLSRNYAGHTGVDISLPGSADYGLPIFASHAGRAVAAYAPGSYGNYVRVYGAGGFSTIYAHMASQGYSGLVRAGQTIGRIGSTGNSSGPHLHFEVRPGGTYEAALAYLSGAGAPPGGGGGGGGFFDWVPNLIDQAKKVVGWIKGMGSTGFPGLIRKSMFGVGGQLIDWINGKVPGPGPIPSLFDRGGILRSGALAANLSGGPERVLDPRTTRNFEMFTQAMNQMVRASAGRSSFGSPTLGDWFGGDGGGGTQVNVKIVAPSSSPTDVARATALAIRMAL